jgi:hypothetical protein
VLCSLPTLVTGYGRSCRISEYANNETARCAPPVREAGEMGIRVRVVITDLKHCYDATLGLEALEGGGGGVLYLFFLDVRVI